MITDEQMIALFFARSEQGIRELDLKYGKVCRRLAHNILGDAQDAEECVSDAYLGAWNAIPPAKPDPLLPYICKIVRNISLKMKAKKRTAKRSSCYTVAMEEIEPCLADMRTTEGAVETRALVRTIERFLDTLSAENRVIFVRRYWFCDSCREIGATVGLTEKTVTVRLARIREKLKTYLKEREASV